MLLAVDIGNTNVNIGVFDEDRFLLECRFATDVRRTYDQYAADINSVLSLKKFDVSSVDGAVISSVVPGLTEIMCKAIHLITGVDALLLSSSVKTDLKIMIDEPSQLGADLIAGAVAAKEAFPLPCLVLDLGTATKISVIDEDGSYLGCVISPGVGLSLSALSSSASLLPSINLKVDNCPAFGTDTVSSMQAGVILGTASMLDGLCDKIEKSIGKKALPIVATGGYSDDIIKYCNRSVLYEPKLLLYGLKSIYGKNI